MMKIATVCKNCGNEIVWFFLKPSNCPHCLCELDDEALTYFKFFKLSASQNHKLSETLEEK